MALGKNGKAYVVDRGNLGGVSSAFISQTVASNEIITAPAVYPAAAGVMIAFKGTGSSCPSGGSTADFMDLTVIRGMSFLTEEELRKAWVQSADM